MTCTVKDPETRRSELIDAAEELFLANGYEETAVSDIVRKIGVAQHVPPYFKSKDGGIHTNIHKRFITTSLLVFLMFSAVLSSAAAQTASLEDIGIVDLYSDIDSADVTIHPEVHLTDITIDAELIFEDEVLRRERFVIDEAPPDIEITKVVYWDLANPGDGYYIARMTLTVAGSVQEVRHHNFSHGITEFPRVYLKYAIPDSRGVSTILSPKTQLGTQAVLTDVEYMLVDGDTVIYRICDYRVNVMQATSLSENWNVRLENNHQYSARVKIKVPSQGQGDSIIVGSADFTAKDDARITELYRDETGASATVEGHSQVPFVGDIVFTVSKDNEIIEEIKKASPVLMSDDDETIEVIWGSKLPAGVYELSVNLVGNDGDVVDVLETVIESEDVGYNASATSATSPEETPGFNVYGAALAIMAIYLFRKDR